METAVIHEIQDLTYLSWSKIRNSSGTAGSFLKAYDDLGPQKIYYKLSNFDSYHGVVGHECVNEIIVDRLLTILGIEHLHYQLIHADILINSNIYTTWVCASSDFKSPHEGKIALDAYYQAERKEKENLLAFCIRNGWEEYIWNMLVVDFLILNRDRHGANIEVLRNKKNKSIRLAPLFDHGLSLIFSSITEEAVSKIKVMEDKPVQCCVGSWSAKDNLNLIPKNKLPLLSPLNLSHKTDIFSGLEEILPQLWRDTIWEMIWERWNYYESFCNQR